MSTFVPDWNICPVFCGTSQHMPNVMETAVTVTARRVSLFLQGYNWLRTEIPATDKSISQLRSFGQSKLGQPLYYHLRCQKSPLLCLVVHLSGCRWYQRCRLAWPSLLIWAPRYDWTRCHWFYCRDWFWGSSPWESKWRPWMSGVHLRYPEVALGWDRLSLCSCNKGELILNPPNQRNVEGVGSAAVWRHLCSPFQFVHDLRRQSNCCHRCAYNSFYI